MQIEVHDEDMKYFDTRFGINDANQVITVALVVLGVVMADLSLMVTVLSKVSPEAVQSFISIIGQNTAGNN